jgi:hypothetical protein
MENRTQNTAGVITVPFVRTEPPSTARHTAKSQSQIQIQTQIQTPNPNLRATTPQHVSIAQTRLSSKHPYYHELALVTPTQGLISLPFERAAVQEDCIRPSWPRTAHTRNGITEVFARSDSTPCCSALLRCHFDCRIWNIACSQHSRMAMPAIPTAWSALSPGLLGSTGACACPSVWCRLSSFVPAEV